MDCFCLLFQKRTPRRKAGDSSGFSLRHACESRHMQQPLPAGRCLPLQRYLSLHGLRSAESLCLSSWSSLLLRWLLSLWWSFLWKSRTLLSWSSDPHHRSTVWSLSLHPHHPYTVWSGFHSAHRMWWLWLSWYPLWWLWWLLSLWFLLCWSLWSLWWWMLWLSLLLW